MFEPQRASGSCRPSPPSLTHLRVYASETRCETQQGRCPANLRLHSSPPVSPNVNRTNGCEPIASHSPSSSVQSAAVSRSPPDRGIHHSDRISMTVESNTHRYRCSSSQSHSTMTGKAAIWGSSTSTQYAELLSRPSGGRRDQGATVVGATSSRESWRPPRSHNHAGLGEVCTSKSANT